MIMKQLKCLRCEHEWTPKIAIPAVCPKCKSGYYNRPRKVKELHPDEKPIPVIEQFEEEMKEVKEDMEDVAMITTYQKLEREPEITATILKALGSIMYRLDKMESRPFGEPIPFNPVYTKEQASESLICARTHQFICNGEGKELCPICKQQNFWKNAQNLRIALEMEGLDKPGEVAPEESFETKAMNCNDRTTNAGKPFCPYKYKGEAHHNYCTLCWELIPIWEDQAAGYKEQMAKKERR